MRPSKQKTPLARLRAMLTIEVGPKEKMRVPLSQKDIAGWLGLSVYNVQSIETGRVRLTEQNAELIARQTSVDPDWLLAGDPAKPPITWDGKPFSQDCFDLQQIQLSTRPRGEVGHWLVCLSFVQNAAMVAEILLSAAEQGNFEMVSLELKAALKKLHPSTDRPIPLTHDAVFSHVCHGTATRPNLDGLLDSFEARLNCQSVMEQLLRERISTYGSRDSKAGQKGIP